MAADLCLLQVGWGTAVTQVAGLGQFFGTAFQHVVFAALQLSNALGVDIEPDNGADFAKFNGQRKADVAEAYDGDGVVLEVHAWRFM